MIKSIILHEIRQIIFNRKAWFCIATMQALLAIIFNWLLNSYLLNQTVLDNTKYGITEEVIHPYFAWFCLLVLFFIPSLTTQSICAEKNNKTLVNYKCAPITATQFILGKFLAINMILACALTLISIMPLSVMISGTLDWGQFATCVIGTYLLLSAAIAIGLACSSFMTNITRSNMVIFFILLSFILLEWAAQFAGHHAIFLQSFGLLAPLKSFLGGILNVKNTFYYIFLICGFLSIAAWRFRRGDLDV